ncbi:MAG: peptidoglycan DD-metalloendopeptidase family protein [Gammaproteobacteria bacterium]
MRAKSAAISRCKAVIILLVSLLIATIAPQFSVVASMTDFQEHEIKLDKVRKRLQALQESVRKDKARAGAASSRLRKTEKEIGELTRQLAGFDRKLKSKNRHLEELRAKHNRELRQMDQLQSTLKVHIRSAYAMGRQGELKLLLSQEDPATVSRVITYFRFLSEARATGIRNAADQLKMLEKLGREINQQTKVLEELRAQRLREAENLGKTRIARSEALVQLKKEIRRKDRELEQLKKDEQRLQRLIDNISEALAASESELEDQTPFAKRKGRLRWPVNGKLVTRYGQNRNVGDLKWRGVLISAPEGSDIYAVSQGRVVFADWLRGFGLLIILEHGDGYMSLYGYNQLLHKEVGDWVSGGELISNVGVSGGQKEPGLYFELRHKGRPVDPAAWFQGSPRKLQVSG